MGTEGGVDAGLVDAGSLVWVFKECKLVLADCKPVTKPQNATKCQTPITYLKTTVGMEIPGLVENTSSIQTK